MVTGRFAPAARPTVRPCPATCPQQPQPATDRTQEKARAVAGAGLASFRRVQCFGTSASVVMRTLISSLTIGT